MSLQDHGPRKFSLIFEMAPARCCHIVTITSGVALQNTEKFISLFNSYRDGFRKVSYVIIVLNNISA